MEKSTSLNRWIGRVGICCFFALLFFFSLHSAVATWAIHNFRSWQAHTSTETIAWNKWFVLLSGINSVSVKAFQLPEKHLCLSSTRYWVIPGCQKWSQFFAYMSCNLQSCHQSNMVFMLQMRTQTQSYYQTCSSFHSWINAKLELL